VPQELERLLQEVEEYVGLGFSDDAKDVIADIQRRFPGNPAVAPRLAALGLEVPPPPRPAPVKREPRAKAPEVPLPRSRPQEAEDLVGDLEPAAEGGLSDLVGSFATSEDDPLSELGLHEPSFSEPPGAPAAGADEFDLGSDLGDLFSQESAASGANAQPAPGGLEDSGLAEIFKEFKKGVDRQLGKEDYDTRYNLGIAYKEMGLIDEAIGEFQLAAKDEGRLLECSSMLGICFLEKGMPLPAIKWFEKGLEVGGRTDEEYRGLRFDLASAYEAAGRIDQALDVFADIYSQDATFRNVADKVRELSAGRR
jgi:tetratricopeptide (TPR) repeat protein